MNSSRALIGIVLGSFSMLTFFGSIYFFFDHNYSYGAVLLVFSLLEGFSGYAFMHRPADPVPQLPTLALADMIAGLTGAFATLAAVREV